MTRKDIGTVRAIFWWTGCIIVILGAYFQWGWAPAVIGAGISLAAYASLNQGDPEP